MKGFIYYIIILILLIPVISYSGIDDLKAIMHTWDNGDKEFLNANFLGAHPFYQNSINNLKSLDDVFLNNRIKYIEDVLKKRLKLIDFYIKFKRLEEILKYAHSLIKEENYKSAIRQLYYIYNELENDDNFNLLENVYELIENGIDKYLVKLLKDEIDNRENELKNIKLPAEISIYNFIDATPDNRFKSFTKTIPDAIKTYLHVNLIESAVGVNIRQIDENNFKLDSKKFKKLRDAGIDIVVTGKISRDEKHKLIIDFEFYDVRTEILVISAKILGNPDETIKNFMETVVKDISKTILTYKPERYYRTSVFRVSGIREEDFGQVEIRKIDVTPGILIKKKQEKVVLTREIYLKYLEKFISLCQSKLIYDENSLTIKGLGVAADRDMKKVMERFNFPAFGINYKFNFPYKKYHRVLFDIEFGFINTQSSKEVFPYHSTNIKTFYFFISSSIKIVLDNKLNISIYPKMGIGLLVMDTLFHKNVWISAQSPGVEPYQKTVVVSRGAMKAGFEINLGLSHVTGLIISYDFIWATDKANTQIVYHFPSVGIYLRL